MKGCWHIRDKRVNEERPRFEMKKVVEATGAFPGGSKKFLVLETPQVLRMLGCQVLGAGDAG